MSSEELRVPQKSEKRSQATGKGGKKNRSGLEIFFSIVIYHGECFIAVCSFFLRSAGNMVLGARLKMHSCLMNGTGARASERKPLSL
jgi:hypothetical protein